MNPTERLKELLLKLSYKKGEVTLSSGKKSDFYFDGKQTSLHPEGLYLLGHLFFELIQKKFPGAEAVGGPTLGADPLVSAISLVSFTKNKAIPAFIIRKEPKKHGTKAWVEGEKNLHTGMNVVLVEDVITTGKSLLEACIKAKEFGLNIIGVAGILDREEGGREAVEDSGYQLETLFKKSDLIGDAK